jgi:signal transduction histidine kinase
MVEQMRRHPIDIAISVGVVVLGLLEILGDSRYSPRGVWIGAIAVTAAALLFRRRAPLPVLVVVLAMVGLASSLDSPEDPTYWFLATVVATYAVGAYPRPPVAIAGLGLVLAYFAGGAAVDGQPIGDIMFVWLLLGGVWAAGRLIERRTNEAARLERQTRILEEEREQRAREAIAEERARIARELHDVVAHSVSVMVVQAGAERLALGPGQESTRETLVSIEKTGRQALAEMRRLLGMLRSDDEELALAPLPSLDHLDSLVAHIREAGLPVELHVEGSRRTLPAGVDISAYRIVQEALTNALRHAGPSRARVVVRYGEGEVELEVADDGRGSQQTNANGQGLVGMRERVALYGGELNTGLREEGGYAVRARLPFDRSGP